ncbi:hypothetical protein [Roseovarius sp. MMSF_3281]|uniref:hypothetical protein n=1 Tax=Roseovarius sp. MMSF_3281 TaxID=3046694 RepID=UPI00273F8CB4|nr:hypothetical protein [Roseovarius sp. MMSF_3281]
MNMITSHNAFEDVRDFVLRERQMCVSEREWKHRLRGYGYAIRESREGQVVTSLVKGSDICTIGAAA